MAKQVAKKKEKKVVKKKAPAVPLSVAPPEEVLKPVVKPPKELSGLLHYSSGVVTYQDTDNSGMVYGGDLEGFIKWIGV